jgi:hypothetical protein
MLSDLSILSMGALGEKLLKFRKMPEIPGNSEIEAKLSGCCWTLWERESPSVT